MIRRFCSADCDVYAYRCGNKEAVYEVYNALCKMTPAPPGILFFVDKDLSDVLEESWPDDPRIFVTDFYSIESYFVSREMMRIICSEIVQVRNVSLDLEVVVEQFSEALACFERKLLAVMAWIVVAKHARLQPNLGNMNIDNLCLLSESCDVRVCRARSQHLARVAGVPRESIRIDRLLAVARQLSRLSAKTYIRGKFEAQFLVKFIKNVIVRLREVAEESGGKIVVNVPLECRSLVEILTPHLGTPDSLGRFLSRNCRASTP